MSFLGRAGTSLEKGPQEEDSGMAQRALETQPLSPSSEQWAWAGALPPPLKGYVHRWPLGSLRSTCSNRKCADKGGNPRRWQRASVHCEPGRSTQQRKNTYNTTQHSSNRSQDITVPSLLASRVKKKRTRGRQRKLCYISEGSSIPSEVKLLYTLGFQKLLTKKTPSQRPWYL